MRAFDYCTETYFVYIHVTRMLFKNGERIEDTEKYTRHFDANNRLISEHNKITGRSKYRINQ